VLARQTNTVHKKRSAEQDIGTEDGKYAAKTRRYEMKKLGEKPEMLLRSDKEIAVHYER